MKKLNFLLAAATLWAAGSTLSSCKKEAVQQAATSTHKTEMSKAKTLTDAEANDLIIEVNNFMPYAQTIASNSGAQAPGTLPAELNDEDVVRYLENGFNFVYALQEGKLRNRSSDQYSITINKNGNSKVSINAVANAFVNAYSHIKQKYIDIACPDNEKVLRVVDVEVSNSSNTTVTLTLHSIFHWKFDPTYPEPAAAVSIPSGEWASFYSMSGNSMAGGTFDPYSCGGTAGAPEVIDGVLHTNWGKYLYSATAPKTKFSLYIPSSPVTVMFQAFAGGGADLSSGSGAPNNPWIISHWGSSHTGMPASILDKNSLVFYKGNHALDGFPERLPADILNYMIDWDKWVLEQKEVALNKSLWSLTHSSSTITKPVYTESYYMEAVFANIYDLTHGGAHITPILKYSTGLITTF